MTKFSSKVKNKFNRIIDDMDSISWLFSKIPQCDFKKNRKLPFKTVIKMIITMGGNTIHKELYDFFNYSSDTPSTSAFVQQRSKILPETFSFLMHELSSAFPVSKTFKNYHIFAIDGSDINIPTDCNDKESFVRTGENIKGYNLWHLNAMYDVLEKRYVNVSVQKYRNMNEHKALIHMVDNTDIKGNVLLVADRNYECYNDIAHISNKGWKFLIRIRDNKGIVQRIRTQNSETFDTDVQLLITRQQTKEIKANPEKYRFIPQSVNFDYLDKKSKEVYPMSFRIVRIKINDNLTETLVTNLERKSFSSDDLKTLYKMRWGIETAFRELKYNIGLSRFHSKKADFILQEIYARLIMYNITMLIACNVNIVQNQSMYKYQINYAEAIHICMKFMRSSKSPPDIEALVAKNILPIRPGRTDIRKIRCQPAMCFIYRIA